MGNRTQGDIALTSILLLMVLLAGYCAARGAGNSPAVGQPAPDFTLNSQKGKPVSLHDFRGKWVLYFYLKDFTSSCTMEAHNCQRDLLRVLHAHTQNHGILHLKSDSHKEFCAKERLSFRWLADTNHEVSSAYDSTMNLFVTRLSARHTFLINSKGIFAKEFLNVNPSAHSDEVLAALTQLQR